jgi:hypothetical protein
MTRHAVLPIGMLLFAAPFARAALPYFTVLADEPGSWPAIFSSIGFQRQPPASAHIFVTRSAAPASAEWFGRVERGAFLVLEADSSLAAMFGFERGKTNARITSLTDARRPTLAIVWEKPLELPVYTMPPDAQVFARDRWTGAPLMAGFRRGAGAVLWVAISPGERGHERFPYLLEALCDLGLDPPFRSSRLWAFFDSAFRSRVDVDYFAPRWHNAGIAALHVAAWQFADSGAEGEQYLRKLIEACHREGILVYAWLELPHVSEKFWNDHPQWREKTGLLQDAALDWRKLVNLANRDAFRAAAAGVRDLITRFDWDGVNLAELYFESLEGTANPSRFTPMNDDVRAEFKSQAGFDPVEIFSTRKDDASARRQFLDFRAGLARRIQEEWLAELEALRRSRPYLDLVLTHVDDRFDTGMRDAIGADAERVLPLLDSHRFTFLIEDPATVWHLGPQRYPSIAEKYRAITARTDRLAVDLNIVPRYQDVYPTRQQTGTELFQLVHAAAASFPRVALYFESSLLAPDLRLLPSSAAAVSQLEALGSRTVVVSAYGFGLPWKGPAVLDGQLWPVWNSSTVWVPAGSHVVEPLKPGAPAVSGVHLTYLNADLRTARFTADGVEFGYLASSRAIAILDRPPLRVEIDGIETTPPLAGPLTLLLPTGQHVVTIR